MDFTQQALGNDLVLQKILGYLSLSDLKECRIVNSKWNYFCWQILKDKTKFVIDFASAAKTEFTFAPSKYVKLEVASDYAISDDEIQKIFSAILNFDVKELVLKINLSLTPSQYSKLFQIVSRSVEHLCFSAFINEDTEESQILECFPSDLKLPSLKSLSLDSNGEISDECMRKSFEKLTAAVTNNLKILDDPLISLIKELSKIPGILEGIEEITNSWHNEDNLFQQVLSRLISLKKFEMIVTTSNLEYAQNVLDKCCSTLEQLKITSTPIKILYLPKMERLETLDIVIFATKEDLQPQIKRKHTNQTFEKLCKLQIICSDISGLAAFFNTFLPSQNNATDNLVIPFAKCMKSIKINHSWTELKALYPETFENICHHFPNAIKTD